MATIKDVAQSAQVSATTVSRVLNRDDNMSVTPEVRMRIFQAAHALGYVSPRQRRAAAEKGLKQMAAYLLDKKQYRGIGYIGGVYEHGGVRIGGRRLSGLRRILEERGLYDPTVFHVGDISRESGYTLARQAAREGRLAEAMLLGSDEVAEGALEAFRELGLRVPKDVAVIIYQDIQTLESKWPTGTCIEMFPDYIWENALEILFGRISQKRTQAVTVVVPTHIRIGDTA